MIVHANLDNWYEHHLPHAGRPENHERLRAAGKALDQAFAELGPRSADQTAAVRKVREAVMTANAAIACDPE